MTDQKYNEDREIISNRPRQKQEFFAPRIYESYSTRVSHFYLSDQIKEPANYIEMVHRIKTAGSDEIIYIYLNTPGGCLTTGIQIISAMAASQARIVTVLEGEACSLGSMIFLCGHEFIVNDHCLFMIHNFSGGGNNGKGHEQVAQLEATVNWFTKMAQDIYIPFLSQDELISVLNGQDIWLDSDQVRIRLVKMIKAIKKQQKDEVKRLKPNT